MTTQALYLRERARRERDVAESVDPFDPLAVPGLHSRPPIGAPGHPRDETLLSVPVRGLSSDPFARDQGTACVLENFIPDRNGLRPRPGLRNVNLTGDVPAGRPGPLVPFEDGQRSQLLTVVDGTLHVIDPAAATVADTNQAVASADVSWNGIFGQGGKLVTIMNGQETWLYDRTANPKVSRIEAGTNPGEVDGADPDDFLDATSYRNRVFIVDGSSTAYYLPLLQVKGEVATLELGGVLPNSASVVMVDSWSMVAGDTLSQRLAFFTDSGHCAVYSGDPESLELQGVFPTGILLHRNCRFRHVSDLLVGTSSGLLSMHGLLAGHAEPYLSDEPLWKARIERVPAANAAGWNACTWQVRNLAFVYNGISDDAAERIIMGINMETGAWFDVNFGEIQAVAMSPLGKRVYVADETAKLYEWAGGWDDKRDIQCKFRLTPINRLRDSGVTELRTYWTGHRGHDSAVSLAATAEADFPAPPIVQDPAAWTPVLGVGELGKLRLADDVDYAPPPTIDGGWRTARRAFHHGHVDIMAPSVQIAVGQKEESTAILGALGVRTKLSKGN